MPKRVVGIQNQGQLAVDVGLAGDRCRDAAIVQWLVAGFEDAADDRGLAPDLAWGQALVCGQAGQKT